MGHAPIDQVFQTALRHHQAGRLPQAERLYREILARQPAHFGALHRLGVIAGQVGRNDAAVESIGRAAALEPRNSVILNDLGNALRASGRLDDAKAVFEQAIALDPNSAHALNNLGIILQTEGKLDEALTALRAAIILKPDLPEAYYNLGMVLRARGQTGEAIAAYRHAISLRSDFPHAYKNLGDVLREEGRLSEASVALRQAILLRSDFPQAHNALGLVLRAQGEINAAIGEYRRAIALNPDLPEAHYNLGRVLQSTGKLDEAIAAYRRVIALQDDNKNAEAYNNLGVTLKKRGDVNEAIVAFRHAIALDLGFAHSHYNLGNALQAIGMLDDAADAYRRAIAVQPDYAEAYCNLGSTLRSQGALDESIAVFRTAIALKPDYHDAQSNLIFILNYHLGYDALAIAREQRRWNSEYAQAPARFIGHQSPGSDHGSSNDCDPDRRIRIGYVSADFRQHVVGRNLLPLFRNQDRQSFEIFCYSDASPEDAMTRQFQQCCDHWQNIALLTDEQVAKKIGDDRIDILVDLALHTAHNRLLVFASKPAPLQVSFAGYPGSTGLTTIDYHLSDPYLDPPGMDESIYSDRVFRLPDSFWCYDPLDCRDVAVNPLPAIDSGRVTFGCLNNFSKVNETILSLWAGVLRQVADSRLLLRAHQGSHRQKTTDILSRHGVDPARVEFLGVHPRREYLELYHRIDLGLDSFPYNGHTTSLDSFWMGVPVVTLVGQTAVSRAGWSQLSDLGLTELAGQTPEQFVRIAVELANDLPRLANLRLTLRSRMEQSPLMDAPRFTRNIESAYRQMWRQWCVGKTTTLSQDRNRT